MLQDIRIRQRDYLIKITQILTQELELEPLLWQVIQMAVDLVGGESGFVALYNESNGWQIQTQLNLTDPELKYIETYLYGLTNMGTNSENSDLLSINMLIKRMRSLNLPDIADGIGIPLINHDKLIGAIVAFRGYKVSFTPYEKSILKSFTDQATIAINNSMLYSENLEEKKRLDAIIRAVADGIFVMNISHKVILVNSALQKMLRLENVNIRNLYHDDILKFKSIEDGLLLEEAEMGGWPLSPDSKHTVKLYSSEKSNSMMSSYISIDEVKKETEIIDKYKVIMGKVVPRGGEVGIDPSIGYRAITTVQVLYPNSVFTDSYLLLAVFDTELEAVNFAKYMTLRFPRFLLHETYSSMNISKGNFRFVPFLDYSHEWTDEELYEKYKCDAEEIDMITSVMRPLEYVLHKETGAVKYTLYGKFENDEEE